MVSVSLAQHTVQYLEDVIKRIRAAHESGTIDSWQQVADILDEVECND